MKTLKRITFLVVALLVSATVAFAQKPNIHILATGGSVYDLVLEHGILTKEELDTILSPENMIKPVKLDIKPRR